MASSVGGGAAAPAKKGWRSAFWEGQTLQEQAAKEADNASGSW